MKQILFLLLIALCSCHSGFSRKGQGDKTDSVRLQKELCALHRYVDSVIKSDTILQQRFHCLGAGLTKDKVTIDFLDIPEDSFEVFKSAFKKNVFASPLLEFNIMSDIIFGPEIIPIKEDSLGRTANIVLSPIPRDIPRGEAINPVSLSMRAEYDYYPLSTTEVKVIITNHSHFAYECGESYSLAYYNSKQKSWETLPTNPIVNSILWIFPSENPTHEQNIKLYTSEVPNRAGKYRIYKAFNRNTKVAYAEFELVDEAGAKRLRRQMDAAWNGKTISSQNIYGSYMRGDSIFVDLINNSIHFQELFRKEMLNYSAINYGAVREPSPVTQRAYPDTLQISMKTEKPVYPIGTESVNVILTNKNLSQQNLSFGEYYFVARKQGNQWIPLYDNSLVQDIGILLKPYSDYQFKAKLYPLFNDNTSGQYRVYKEVEFDGTDRKWYMIAEFKIE